MRPAMLTAALLAAATGAQAHSMAVAAASVFPAKQASTRRQPPLALLIPGDSAAEQVLIGGGLNFINIYMGVITFRILLSWFPQAQGVQFLRPVFTVSDVYLNLFRGIIPPIAGLDLSPIAAFFTLNLLSNSVLTLGAHEPPTGSDGQPLSPPRRIETIATRLRRAHLLPN